MSTETESRRVLLIRDTKANGYVMLAKSYEVDSVEPDGTVNVKCWSFPTLSKPSGMNIVPLHPSEFRWIVGCYLPGELAIPSTQEKAEMAKRTKKRAGTVAGGQQTLMEDVADQYPEEVTDAADQFAKTHRAHAKAKTAKDAARDKVLEMMEEHGIDKIPIEIDGRDKLVVLDNKTRLKIMKRKEPVGASQEDVAAEA